MIDRTIPFYNIILRCDDYKFMDIVLPAGFSILPYEKGFEKEWAKLEHGIGDFDSLELAEEYFLEEYIKNNTCFENILFLLNENRKVIGSCIAWRDKRGDVFVPSLHWLIMDEKYQGLGLGKALACATMNVFAKQNKIPVYIHTQPWSWKAILLYLDVGFKVQKSDTFANYINQYKEAMEEIKKVVSEENFNKIKDFSCF